MTKKNQETILVTGASGMLGLKLCQTLKSRGFNVIGTYHSHPGLLSLEIEKLKLDISLPELVKQVANKHNNIDTIIHCAAMTNVNKCELEKKLCFSVNVTGTKNIVDIARRFGANLIYISTPMVFSGIRGDYKETSKSKPLNYYAKTKLLGEKEVLKYKKGLVLRANPIGIRPPGAHPSFIQWFVNAAQNNKSFTLFTDVRINPIGTTTLANMVCDLMARFKLGVLHLGSADVVNKADIWRLIVSKFPGFTGKVTEKSIDKTKVGKIAPRPKEMWLNVSKAKALGFKMPFWKKEIDITLKDFNI